MVRFICTCFLPNTDDLQIQTTKKHIQKGEHSQRLKVRFLKIKKKKSVPCVNIFQIESKGLNKYSKRIYKTTKNLLTGSTDKDEEYQQKAKENIVETISFWHPNLTINIVDDHTPWQRNQVPPPLNDCKHILIYLVYI